MTEKQRLRSIGDIARIAGVSKSTVSRALNDSPLIGIETKERIRAIAKEHEFWPSVTARALSTRASRTVAYVIDAYDSECGLESPFSLEIMGGAATGLRELDYDMLVVQADQRRGDWAAEYLGSGRVDGFILMPYENKRLHVERLLELDAPFVVWGFRDERRFCSLSSDNRRGGYLAGELLAGLGKRSIGFIGGDCADPEVVDRRKGFLEALAGGGAGNALLGEASGDFSEASGHAAALELSRRHDGLDAVFAVGDMMAIGAMRAFAERGVRVPEDVAVVGYDDLFVSAFTTPALTTVSQHIADAGRRLARDVVARIERGVAEAATIPVELIRRASA
ncbi:MAG: LacI family transcriptional regulator [Spirochaetes bacterium]|nr:LacI family transcriptional regulator [Spirochaetota bacterium]MBU1079641.1 LacI family transcriptional regulator [Spirochaetota bacterium]